MKLTAVRSSNVSAIGYDASTRTMVARFKSGGVYRYGRVEPEQHAELMSCESIGARLAVQFARQPHLHPVEKVTPQEADTFTYEESEPCQK